MDKPIERGFSNVKSYLRANEFEVINNPIDWINKAFHLYSQNGSKSNCAAGNWQQYFENYNNYINDF